MKIGDIVDVITGCHDCGIVPATVLDFFDDRAQVEVIGELPHKARDRVVWVAISKLKSRIKE